MRVTEGVRVTKRTRISTRIKTNLFVLTDQIWNFYLSVWSIWTDFNGIFILSADRGRWHSRGQRFDLTYLHQKSGKLLVFWTFSYFYDNRFSPDNRLALVFTLMAFCLLDPSVFIVSITSFACIFLGSRVGDKKLRCG